MRDFRTLQVWRRSHALTLQLYRVTAKFPGDERWGLVTQIRRAAASIPANIAEGCGRAGDAELARFMQIALGSASELEYHLILAHDLGYITQEKSVTFSDEVVQLKKMLTTFIKRVRARLKSAL